MPRVAQAARKGRTVERVSRVAATYQKRTKGRGNGEGTIYPRTEKRRKADGTVELVERWCTAIAVEDRSRKVLYGKTYDEVKKKRDEALRLLADGRPLADERLTVGERCEYWLEHVVKPNR